MSTEPNRSNAFRHAIERTDPYAFRRAIEHADVPAVLATLAPKVMFRSPITHTPYVGREGLGDVLAAVMRVFEDFHYVAEYRSPNGAVLQFRTRIGDRYLEGADFLTFGDDGLITEFTVMVRPYSAATALKDAMAAQLAAYTQANTGSTP